jgi:hypothetical protein
MPAAIMATPMARRRGLDAGAAAGAGDGFIDDGCTGTGDWNVESRGSLPRQPNVWHQRRAQRVRCMPGLGRARKLPVGLSPVGDPNYGDYADTIADRVEDAE